MEDESGYNVSRKYQLLKRTRLLHKICFLLSFFSASTNLTFAQKNLVIPSGWTEITQLDHSILLDLRYATVHNFVKTPLYPCPRAFLRFEVATALHQAQASLQKKGFGLKIFDAYRPASIQKRLWKIKPDERYVANPAKGSMHNRGMALDLTIVDKNGRELDMGTPYDYFGVEAYHDHPHPNPVVRANRKLLLETMEAHGFRHTRTEWWHYSLKGQKWGISDWAWSCPG